MLTREVFFEEEGGWSSLNRHLMNVHLSMCFSCEGLAIWRADELIYPHGDVSIAPVEEMPADVKAIFLEANDILDKSPERAAASCPPPLCFKSSCRTSGRRARNINNDIASLVAKGLDTRIQKALDVVRVAGNDAVHPGQIDWDDDKTVATQLFGNSCKLDRRDPDNAEEAHRRSVRSGRAGYTSRPRSKNATRPNRSRGRSDEPTID